VRREYRIRDHKVETINSRSGTTHPRQPPFSWHRGAGSSGPLERLTERCSRKRFGRCAPSPGESIRGAHGCRVEARSPVADLGAALRRTATCLAPAQAGTDRCALAWAIDEPQPVPWGIHRLASSSEEMVDDLLSRLKELPVRFVP